jgi:hypothetical protein
MCRMANMAVRLGEEGSKAKAAQQAVSAATSGEAGPT